MAQDTRTTPEPDTGPTLEAAEHADRTARIVVGVDGSAGSLAALEWALQEGRLRGNAVHALMAWRRPQAYGDAGIWSAGLWPEDYNPATAAEQVLTDELAVVAEHDAGAGANQNAGVTSETLEGHPAQVLLSAAVGSALLVVGSRGHGGFVGTLLGSVSQHVVTHANCPVVVVPAPRPPVADARE